MTPLIKRLRSADKVSALFDEAGRRIDARTIRSCIDQGWAEPWFANPLKPDWIVCRLTCAGRDVALGLGPDGAGEDLDGDDA